MSVEQKKEDQKRLNQKTANKNIADLIEKARNDGLNFDPVVFLDKCREVFESSYKNGTWDCTKKSDYLDSRYSFFNVIDFLLDKGFIWAAEQLLIGWWDSIGERQREGSEHLYRAYTSYKLIELYLKQKDRGAALRWAILTQANDLLDKHPEGGGGGKQWLRSTLGMTESELKEFETMATVALKNIEKPNQGKPLPAWFDEDLLVKLALKDLSYAHLFLEPSSVREFPLSKPYLQTLLGQVNLNTGTNKEKGDRLEDLASYLFLLIPGWLPRRNLFDQNEGFESDLVIENLNPASNLASELFGRNFLVECKNWNNSVGVQDVGYFLHRMRLTHCNFGVIFAKSGITGGESDGETAARSLIRRTFHENKITCIVIDNNDLEGLVKGETTFWSMLLSKIELFRFGKVRMPKG